jgi:periplasmic protein TonB
MPMLEMTDRDAFGLTPRTQYPAARVVSLRDMAVFVAIGILHAAGIYYFGTQMAASGQSLWSQLEVSFIPRQKPHDPPPPPPLPELLTDAFNEIPLIDIPAPSVDVAEPAEEGKAIHIDTPVPLPEEQTQLAPPQGDEGFGPLTKPRVLSRPKVQDRYPPASIAYRESGRSVVKVCISEQGTVTNVELVQSSGFHRLDEAAVDLGWDYVFAPAMRESKAVAVCLPYGITFRINIGGGKRH